MTHDQLATNMNETNARQALGLIELAHKNIELGYKIADLHRQLQERDTTIARLQRLVAQREEAGGPLVSNAEVLTMADYVEGMEP
jgi:hypothetical protein